MGSAYSFAYMGLPNVNQVFFFFKWAFCSCMHQFVFTRKPKVQSLKCRPRCCQPQIRPFLFTTLSSTVTWCFYLPSPLPPLCSRLWPPAPVSTLTISSLRYLKCKSLLGYSKTWHYSSISTASLALNERNRPQNKPLLAWHVLSPYRWRVATCQSSDGFIS